jgi:hypothetical protein
MQEAELAAAEAKHKTLLKRLQRGGHDTRNLEKKFAETKARLTGNSSGLRETQTAAQTVSEVYKRNNQQGMSEIMNHELNLERKKHQLEAQLAQQQQQQQQASNANEKLNTKENYALSSDQKSQIQQIFQMLREDTTGLPAELNEDNLKQLLKSVGRYSSKDDHSIPKSTATSQQKLKEKEVKSAPRLGSTAGGDKKPPIWNYKNLAAKKAMKNSEKDPFYHERAKFVEERRQKRLEYYQSLTKKNSDKYNEYVEKNKRMQAGQSNDDDTSSTVDGTFSRNDNRRESTASSMSIASNQTYSNNNNNNNISSFSKPQQESIFNLLGKNLAANTIYEEDEVSGDVYAKPPHHLQSNNNYNQSHRSQHVAAAAAPKNVNSSFDDYNNSGFVPFMRTNEFLDPTHAESPIPPSRESSAIKQNRDKARQVLFLT